MEANHNSIAESGRFRKKLLLREDQIEKVNEIKDDALIQPTVVTVKKDCSVKIALDARALNHEKDKD